MGTLRPSDVPYSHRMCVVAVNQFVYLQNMVLKLSLPLFISSVHLRSDDEPVYFTPRYNGPYDEKLIKNKKNIHL